MKKAFTLVELIAVIVILGVISIIVVPTVNDIIKNSREKAYDAQINNIISAAKKMVNEDPSLIPDDDSSFEISINSLIENGYLKASEEGIKNPKNSDEILNGCVNISYSSEYNQYIYDYIESCS